MRDEWLVRLYEPSCDRHLRLWLDSGACPKDFGIRFLLNPETREILDPGKPLQLQGVPFGSLLIVTTELKEQEKEYADQSKL